LRLGCPVPSVVKNPELPRHGNFFAKFSTPWKKLSTPWKIVSTPWKFRIFDGKRGSGAEHTGKGGTARPRPGHASTSAEPPHLICAFAQLCKCAISIWHGDARPDEGGAGFVAPEGGTANRRNSFRPSDWRTRMRGCACRWLLGCGGGARWCSLLPFRRNK
jgi:hypothetical protein